MLIYCTRGADEVTFGKNHEIVYRWEPNHKGDHLCEVSDPRHIAALLQSPDIYIPYGDGEIPAEVIQAMNTLKAQQSRGPSHQYELLREFCTEDDDNHLVLVRIPHDAYEAIKSGEADLFIEEVDDKEPEVKPVAEDVLDQMDTADLDGLRKMAEARGIKVDARWRENKLRSVIKEYERTGEVSED